MSASSLAVTVLGRGAIGGVVAAELAAGRVRGCTLAGAVDRATTGAERIAAFARAGAVVEAAGHGALVEHAEAVLAAGTDLVVCSAGALARPELAHLVAELGAPRRPGRGRTMLVSGAIGGLDALRSVCRGGPVSSVRLSTTKRPEAFGLAPDHRGRVFAGSAREAALALPATANVGVTLAVATVGLDAARVHVDAEPGATRTVHRVEVDADLGTYRFEFANHPSMASPRTSALVPWSVVTALEALTAERDAAPDGGRP